MDMVVMQLWQMAIVMWQLIVYTILNVLHLLLLPPCQFWCAQIWYILVLFNGLNVSYSQLAGCGTEDNRTYKGQIDVLHSTLACFFRICALSDRSSSCRFPYAASISKAGRHANRKTPNNRYMRTKHYQQNQE